MSNATAVIHKYCWKMLQKHKKPYKPTPKQQQIKREKWRHENITPCTQNFYLASKLPQENITDNNSENRADAGFYFSHYMAKGKSSR